MIYLSAIIYFQICFLNNFSHGESLAIKKDENINKICPSPAYFQKKLSHDFFLLIYFCLSNRGINDEKIHRQFYGSTTLAGRASTLDQRFKENDLRKTQSSTIWKILKSRKSPSKFFVISKSKESLPKGSVVILGALLGTSSLK